MRRRLNGAVFSSSLPDSILAESRRSLRRVSSRVGGTLGRFQAVLDERIGGLGQRHVDHPQDGIHRRAQFVADIGQELALRFVGGLGRLRRFPHRFFRPFAFADVGDGRFGKGALASSDHGDANYLNGDRAASAGYKTQLGGRLPMLAAAPPDVLLKSGSIGHGHMFGELVAPRSSVLAKHGCPARLISWM